MSIERKQSERMSLGIVIDGVSYDLPGWLLTAALALNGDEEAINNMAKPDFAVHLKKLKNQTLELTRSDDPKKKMSVFRPEPTPPSDRIKFADHYWLGVIDFDGRMWDVRVLQWSPAAKRWCVSGDIATGSYVDTSGWKCLNICPQPEPQM